MQNFFERLRGFATMPTSLPMPDRQLPLRRQQSGWTKESFPQEYPADWNLGCFLIYHRAAHRNTTRHIVCRLWPGAFWTDTQWIPSVQLCVPDQRVQYLWLCIFYRIEQRSALCADLVSQNTGLPDGSGSATSTASRDQRSLVLGCNCWTFNFMRYRNFCRPET